MTPPPLKSFDTFKRKTGSIGITSKIKGGKKCGLEISENEGVFRRSHRMLLFHIRWVPSTTTANQWMDGMRRKWTHSHPVLVLLIRPVRACVVKKKGLKRIRVTTNGGICYQDNIKVRFSFGLGNSDEMCYAIMNNVFMWMWYAEGFYCAILRHFHPKYNGLKKSRASWQLKAKWYQLLDSPPFSMQFWPSHIAFFDIM